jgi:hypothetical protein
MSVATKLAAKERIMRECFPELIVPFSVGEFDDRLTRVRQVMAREDIDLLYLGSPESMFYLSGYQAEWYQGQGPKDWLPLSGLALHMDHDQFILFDEEEEALLGRYSSMRKPAYGMIVGGWGVMSSALGFPRIGWAPLSMIRTRILAIGSFAPERWSISKACFTRQRTRGWLG